MNANDMLDLALGQADPELELALEADPEAAATVERLSRAIGRLLDDGSAYDPPPGLAERTMRFVAEASHSRRRRTILDFAPSRVPFRWADVAVAAGIFLAGVLTLLPAAQRSKQRLDQASCTYNLQQLGRALWLYGNEHNHYPLVDPKAPVGGYLAMLHDGGQLSEEGLSAMECPSVNKSHNHEPLPDYATLCRLSKDDPDRVVHMLCTNYAYNPGYRDRVRNELVNPADHLATRPLLGDGPPLENYRTVLAGNSRNHGGRGQNVLYADLHTGWHNTRRISPLDPDMYLNDDHRLAPGLSETDTALLPSLVPSGGR